MDVEEEAGDENDDDDSSTANEHELCQEFISKLQKEIKKGTR